MAGILYLAMLAGGVVLTFTYATPIVGWLVWLLFHPLQPFAWAGLATVIALDTLAAAGVPMGVASSSPPAHIERVLTNLGVRDRFATAWSGCDVPRSKPFPASAARPLT